VPNALHAGGETRLRPRGRVRLRVVSTPPAKPLSVLEILYHGFPRPGLEWEVVLWRVRNLPNLIRGLRQVALARLFRIPTHYGQLFLRVRRADGVVLDYGLASLRVVTDAGVAYLVDACQGLVEPENLKYHGFGTGTNAEAASDTALQTELTTEYPIDNTRPTGTTTEGASSNVYRTVGSLDPDSTVAITEHGVFSQAPTGGGSLLDRSKFAPVTVNAVGDTLQAIYDLTLVSGG